MARSAAATAVPPTTTTDPIILFINCNNNSSSNNVATATIIVISSATDVTSEGTPWQRLATSCSSSTRNPTMRLPARNSHTPLVIATSTSYITYTIVIIIIPSTVPIGVKRDSLLVNILRRLLGVAVILLICTRHTNYCPTTGLPATGNRDTRTSSIASTEPQNDTRMRPTKTTLPPSLP